MRPLRLDWEAPCPVFSVNPQRLTGLQPRLNFVACMQVPLSRDVTPPSPPPPPLACSYLFDAALGKSRDASKIVLLAAASAYQAALPPPLDAGTMDGGLQVGGVWGGGGVQPPLLTRQRCRLPLMTLPWTEVCRWEDWGAGMRMRPHVRMEDCQWA